MSIRTIGVLFLGIAIGLTLGFVKGEQLQDQAQANVNTPVSDFPIAEQLTRLKKTTDRDRVYFRDQIEAYRRMLNIHDTPLTDGARQLGMFCTEEYGNHGQSGSGTRVWRPRNDGRCYIEDHLSGY